HQCHQAFYRPDNMVLVVIGDLEPERVFERAGLMEAHKGGRPPAMPLPVPTASDKVQSHSHRRSMHLSRPICLFGVKDRAVGLSGADLLKRQVEMDILLDALFGKSSPFYWQLYSRNLISDDFFSDYLALPSFAYTCVGGESLEPDRLVEAIRAEIRRTAEQGLDSETIERLKRKTLGEFISSFNSSDGLSFALSSSLLTDTRYEDIPAILEQVNARSLHERLLEQLHPDNTAVAVIEPR
ncbi:MAG: M16 family metallopeptidase, partial [Bacillota bacterium]